MSELLKKVQKAIDDHQLIQPGDGLVIAVSGGPDSMALLHLLVVLRPDWDLRLQVVHINHGLRGEEAEREAAFVEEISHQWSVPAKICRVNVYQQAQAWKCSIQEAGRRVRYQLLDEAALKHGCQGIAVAHHAQDQAETILENILRGSGPNGLGAMYYRRGKIIRPLQNITRTEIEAYLEANRIPFCLDPSNLKPVYLRNRIRLELLPHLEEKYNPNLIQSLNRMAEIMREENDLLDSLTQEAVTRCRIFDLFPEQNGGEGIRLKSGQETVVLLISSLLAEPKALQRRLVRQVLEEMVGNLREFTYQHIESILELAVNPVGGRKVYIPGNLQGRREKKWLIIEPRLVRRKKER